MNTAVDQTVEQQLRFQAYLLDVVEQAVIATDLQGKVLFWNQFAEQLYGWSKLEALGRQLRELLTPQQSIAIADEVMDTLRAGNSWGGEFLVHDRAGHEFVVDVTDTPIFDQAGKLMGIIGISRDATLRRQYEEALKSSEEFNRSILESTTDCIKVLELDGSLLLINGPGLCAMEIDDFSQYVGRSWLDFWEGETRVLALNAIDMAKQGLVGQFDGPCRTRKGNLRFWDVVVSSIIDVSGKPKRLVAVSRDVTQQRDSVDELKRSEEKYRALFYRSAIGKAEIDFDTGRLTRVNPKLCTIFGYSEQELTEFKLQELIYRDDIASGRLAQSTALSSLVSETSAEYRIIRKDKALRWIEANISLVRNDEGYPSYAIAAIQDITDRKRVEHEQQLLAALGPVLSQAYNEQDIAQGASNIIVPTLADWCAIAIVESSGMINIIAEAHAEKWHAKNFDGIRAGEKIDFSNSKTRIPPVYQGQDELYKRMTDAEFGNLHPSRQTILAELRAQGLHSLLYVPLMVRGQLMGVLGLGLMDIDRDFHDHDLLMAKEVARRIAFEFDNARLLYSERESRQAIETIASRIARLQQVTAALSQAVSPEDVVQTIVDESLRAFDAQAAALNMLESVGKDESLIHIVYSRGYADDLVQQYRTYSLVEPVPAAVAVRTGQALWYSSRAALEHHYPNLVVALKASHEHSMAVLPLHTDRGILGVLVLSFGHVEAFDRSQRDFLLTLANQCAQAVERSRLYRAEQIARDEADRVAHRSAFMAKSSQTLNTSIEFETRLHQVATLAVPELADWCVISIVASNASVRIAATAHVDTDTDKQLHAWVKSESMGQIISDYLSQILKSGRKTFVSNLTEQDFRLLTGSNEKFMDIWDSQKNHAFVTVPLSVHGHTFGAVHMGLRDQQHDDAYISLIEEWVNHMALSLDNARLYRELQTVNTDLEQRVVQRTEAFKASRDQLRNLTGRLQAAREEERARVSREVHDVIGQILTGLKMDISALGRQLQQEHSPALTKIKDLNGLLDEAIRSVRKVATELRPAILDNFGLVAAVEWQLREFESRSDIVCDFNCSVEEVSLKGERATAVFRLIQEALTNVARHAGATEVSVSMFELNGQLFVTIQDNGRGISEQDLSANRSLGLVGMRERVNLLEGKIDFQGQPGRGTKISVVLPLLIE